MDLTVSPGPGRRVVPHVFRLEPKTKVDHILGSLQQIKVLRVKGSDILPNLLHVMCPYNTPLTLVSYVVYIHSPKPLSILILLIIIITSVDVIELSRLRCPLGVPSDFH